MYTSQNERQRRGGWWLRLTAPEGAVNYDNALTRQDREHLRHSQLTSFTAPFVFLAPLLLLQQSINVGTAAGIIVLMSTSVLALVFNRAGKQVFAAILLVISMDAVIEGTLLTAPGGLGSGWLLTFDLFVIPLITAGVLLNRRFVWFFAVLHISCILGDFYFLPHAPDLIKLVAQWNGPTIAYARPIIIQIGACLLCWLAIRSTDDAISRADRAQLVAELQSSIALEKQELEAGIQELLRTLTSAANGHYMRSELPRDSSLWRVSSAIDTLFARLQNKRQIEEAANQLMRDIHHLATQLQNARAGAPVRWPFPSNSPLDPLIRELRALFPGSTPKTSPAETRSLKFPPNG